MIISVSTREVTVDGIVKYIGQVELDGQQYQVARNCATVEIADKRARMVANHIVSYMKQAGMAYILAFLQVDID